MMRPPFGVLSASGADQRLGYAAAASSANFLRA